MAKDFAKTLPQVIEKLAGANEEFNQILFDTDADQELGPPAKEAALAKFEKSLARPLPPSYRQFLILHDGWRGFNGESDLLSIKQRSAPRIVDKIAQFVKVKKDLKQPYHDDNLVIAAGELTTYIVYLDYAAVRKDGECDVVEYGYEEGELSRYHNLEQFFKTRRKDLLAAIEAEKGNDLDFDDDDDDK